MSQNLQTAGLSSLNTGTNEIGAVANYDTNLINSANSGNYSSLIQAAGPQIGSISSGFSQAKQNILNTTPAGPGRDAALAQLPAQQGAATASTLNSSYQTALQQLAGLGQTSAGIGLQSLGGGISALGGASSSNQAYAQQTAAASPWAQIAPLFGALGTAAGGTNFKPGSSSASSVADPLAAIS